MVKSRPLVRTAIVCAPGQLLSGGHRRPIWHPDRRLRRDLCDAPHHVEAVLSQTAPFRQSRIGIWLSAQGSRSLGMIGAHMMLPAAMIPLWMIFGEASLAAHLGLIGVGILSWLAPMAFPCRGPEEEVRVYSLVSLAGVVASFALGFSYVPEANAGQPTLFLGLDERVGFSAYFLWQSVLAVAPWRRPTIIDRDGDLEDRTKASAVPAGA